MSFWDRVILRLYYSLVEALPGGPAAALSILERAYQMGLLNIAALNDLSILLLKAISPTKSPLRPGVERDFLRRGLHLQRARPRVWRLLASSVPPRDLELLNLGREGTPQQRGIVVDIIFRLYLPALRLFLGRLYLDDPNNYTSQAVQLLVRAIGFYWRLPLRTISFLCWLYRLVLWSLPVANGSAPPDNWPGAPLPPWLNALDWDEQRFLRCCLQTLSLAERILVYLSFYAELNVQQITCVLQAARPLTEAEVIAALVQSWEKILACLAGNHGSSGTHPPKEK